MTRRWHNHQPGSHDSCKPTCKADKPWSQEEPKSLEARIPPACCVWEPRFDKKGNQLPGKTLDCSLCRTEKPGGTDDRFGDTENVGPPGRPGF